VQARYGATLDNSHSLSASTFSVPRARVGIVGRLGGQTKYELSADFGAGQAELFTAVAEFSLHRHLSITVGQMRVPFSRSTLTPEERLAFPERSMATGEFAYLRDIGIAATVNGLNDRLAATVGIFNGAGPNRLNDNRDPMFLVRVQGVPLGTPWLPEEGDPSRTEKLGITVGLTGTMDLVPVPDIYGYTSGSAVPPRSITNPDTDGNGRRDDVRVVQVSGDLAARFRRIALEAEFYERRENWGQIPQLGASAPLIVQNRFRGGFGQLSYFIWRDRLQIAARASSARLSPLTLGGRVRPDVPCGLPAPAPSTCRLPYADVRSEISGLVAYRLAGVRLSVSLARYHWASDVVAQPPAATETQLILQTQWIL
jgi:hypothetical protein